MLKQINKNPARFFRSPTLETIRMVEKTIEKFNGELKKTPLWGKLPRKIQWRTFLTILDYLQEINKIVITNEGIIVYIWNPEGAEEYLKNKNLYYEKIKRKTKN